MNVPPETEPTDNVNENVEQDQLPGNSNAAESQPGAPIGAKVPVFENLVPSEGNGQNSIHRFLDVKVSVSAELGNVSVPIGDLLKLSEGSVLELNRAISEPVDLVAQGVRIARGEVVVIDDCFAIRVNEIEGQT